MQWMFDACERRRRAWRRVRALEDELARVAGERVSLSAQQASALADAYSQQELRAVEKAQKPA